jgi:hypothetical protein
MDHRLLAAVLLVGSAPAPALKFDTLTIAPDTYVLFIRDCGTLPEDLRAGVSICPDHQTSFSGPDRKAGYAGDDATLRGLLRSRKYREAWLYSGGGNLDQGVRIGRTFREFGMTVRVPNTSRVLQALQRSGKPWPERAGPPPLIRCVSACTVAFMGGMFRYLDDGAAYEVHSGSAYTSMRPEVLTELRKDPRLLRAIANNEQQDAFYWAIRLLGLFQNTLLQTLPPDRRPGCSGRPALPQPWCEQDEALRQWVRQIRSDYSDAQFQADIERLRTEGPASLQDILMRIERESMRNVIAYLEERIQTLGPRAGPALRMVDVMYEVSIKETDILSRETMYRMGYLTKDLE